MKTKWESETRQGGAGYSVFELRRGRRPVCTFLSRREAEQTRRHLAETTTDRWSVRRSGGTPGRTPGEKIWRFLQNALDKFVKRCYI
jgi:hypothetical protein